MSRSKGKRYDSESKLNIKKVIAVIVAIAVIIMFVLGIKTLLTKDKTETTNTVTSFYPVYTNEKWGVINQTGNIVIPAEYNQMITIPDSKVDLFICVYDVNYENNTYKTKVIDSKNEEKFTNYDLVEAIENFDTNNILWYEEGVLKVKKGDLYGLIDYTGKEILPIEYTNIDALQGIKNSLIIKKNDQVGLCDNKGNIIINPEYKEIKPVGDDYKNGYIVISNENKYGLIDFTKKVVLEAKYEEIKNVASSNIYIVKEDGKLKAINATKDTLIEEKFDDIKQINDENLVFVENNKYGIITTNGEIKVKAEYEDIQYAFSNNYIAKKNGKYGIINTSNETMLPFEYATISYRKEAGFVEAGLEDSITTQILNDKLEKKLEGILVEVNESKAYIRMRINDEYKYYNFKFEEMKSSDILTQNNIFLSKNNDKYGYVDSTGNVVVDYIYEDATEQNSFGYASVKKDGKWGAIDKDGKQVAENKYELEENIIIDFIGKWHIAQDVNSYYYTDM